MAVMTANKYIETAFAIERDCKTVYALGMFGQVITEDIIQQKAKQLPGWYTADKIIELRQLIGKGYRGFDCVCFLKAILWGFPQTVYCSHGVPDFGSDDKSMLSSDSKDFSSIQPGEVVQMPGHIGLYIGDNLVAECSPKWANGVQITALGNRGGKTGYNSRIWTSHGKLKYIDYTVAKPVPDSVPAGRMRPADNKKFQSWLNANYSTGLAVDGHCGPATIKAAVKALQTELNRKYNCKLAVDGKPGPLTQAVLSAHMIVPKQAGALVYIMQGLLYGKGYNPGGFDGSYGVHGGTACRKCVEQYQRDHGLEVDGKVGGQTLSKLTA